MIVDSDLQLAYKECGRITKREAANFYYAFLTLPKNRRRAIYAVYAFCRYCDDAVDDESSIDSKRSEERRVGKECRSRWSP